MNHRIYSSIEISTSHQLHAEISGHGDHVQQWVTDGHTAVIGHHYQEEALSGRQHKEEAHLGGTVQHRNASVLSPKVHQNPRESDGHVTDFQGGKICQEKIHGFVQCRVKPS